MPEITPNRPETRVSAPEIEVRDFIGNVSLRAASEGSKSPGTLVGYAAVFNKYSVDLGYFVEKLDPAAFDGNIRADDIRALKNHDPNMLLGRNVSGTLRLSTDETGLRMEIDLPDTSTGRDTAEEVRRGDMSGCSFAFIADIVEWDDSGAVPVRTIKRCKTVFDVGPVTYPAYDQTSVAVRSFHAHLAERAKDAPATPPPHPGYANEHARLRLLEA